MKIKETVVFDLDSKMKARKIINLPQLALESGIPIRIIEGIYCNDIKNVPDGQLKKLCEFFGCEFSDLLSDYTKETLEEKRRFFKKTSFYKDEGIVYFVKAVGGEFDGYTKIGFSSDVEKRLKTLSYELGCQIVPLHYIPSNDVINLEKLLHKFFRERNVKGEWFDLSDIHINLFK